MSASMSSDAYGTHAGAAVDGNFNPDFDVGSCIRTEEAVGSWWAVDLQKQYTIKTVILTNRIKACKYTEI